MIGEICATIKNYFCKEKYFGEFEVRDGCLSSTSLTLNNLLVSGQYIRIVGSTFNDGVYQYTGNMPELLDEKFVGAVWSMAVPRDFLSLVDEVERWTAENQKVIDSPYASESFAGYSYSKATTAAGGAYDWKIHFAPRLNRWRKLRV